MAWAGTGDHPDAVALQVRKDTQHEDVREPLDAQAFGAFPSAFAPAARLKGKICRQ